MTMTFEERCENIDGVLALVLEEYALTDVLESLLRIARNQTNEQICPSGHDRTNWHMAARFLNDVVNRVRGSHCDSRPIRPAGEPR
jgi:hypothetical protein